MPTSNTTKSPKATKTASKKQQPATTSASQHAKNRQGKTKKKNTKTKAQNVSCMRKFFAILTRFLFILHSVVAVWRVSMAFGEIYVFAVSIGAVLVFFEMIYTLAVRGGMETKWFCPSMLCYLLTVVPCLWLLEFKEIEEITMANPACNNFTIPVNTSTPANQSVTEAARIKRDVFENITMATTSNYGEVTMNATIPSTIINTTVAMVLRPKTSTHLPTSYAKFEEKVDEVIHIFENTTRIIQDGMKDFLVSINQLEPRNWRLALHQTLLFVLVIGRWALPKGEITREQLSQLLLVFIGVGADILEFVTETIDDEHYLACEYTIIYFLYTTWSCSLIQFCLVLTASKSRTTRIGFQDTAPTRISRANNCCARSIFNSAEDWGILVTMWFQDIPFLTFRLYVMIVYKDVHQMMIFFTGKNALVVALQMYRFYVLKKKPNKLKKSSLLPEEELIPLRGVLQDLSKQKGYAAKNIHENFVLDATFKTKESGDVIVRMTLDRRTLERNKEK